MDRMSIDAAVSANGRRIELSFLLDSGQMYTCLPEPVWRDLAINEKRPETLHRGDGSARRVAVGECVIHVDELGEVTTPVILGTAGDLAILGVLTVAELGFVLDPLSREIEPAVLWLKGSGPVGRGKLPTVSGLADPPAGNDRLASG